MHEINIEWNQIEREEKEKESAKEREREEKEENKVRWVYLETFSNIVFITTSITIIFVIAVLVLNILFD